VRAGADRAELTAEFSVEDNRNARDWLEESDLASDDSCLLRRTINSNGRSRAYINGTPVTVAQIQSLGQKLVEIHGQNEHLRMTRTSEQFRLLDGSGNYANEISLLEKSFDQWQQTASELDALTQDAALSDAELEFLNYQLAELQQHDLSAESLKARQIEHDRLAAGDSLLEALTFSIEMLDPVSSVDHDGVNSDLNTALAHLQKFESLDSDINDASKMLQEAVVNCGEAVSSLRIARDRLDLDPARFEELSNTLGQLHDLSRKHHVSMEGLEGVMQALTSRIDKASGSEQHRIQLQAELQKRLDTYRSAAVRLHTKRKQHAAELSTRVTGLMAELGMAGGTFELAVTLVPESRPSLRGDDETQILISANPGLPPGPLSKIASGGELSRISLAIKVAASGGGDQVTQIFDEVDAGVGGETANAVGKLMKRLSGNSQALCVTHLAQVAVCATHQLQVSKAIGEGSTQVETTLLDETARVDEIARMLSGKVSEQSRAHALELLNTRSVTD
jgi:DNA repair protein RecN (Recombination protein N)